MISLLVEFYGIWVLVAYLTQKNDWAHLFAHS